MVFFRDRNLTESTVTLPTTCSKSSGKGRRYTVLRVILLSSLKTTQKRTLSFFATKKTGLLHGEVDFFITPCWSMRSTSCWISYLPRHEVLRGVLLNGEAEPVSILWEAEVLNPGGLSLVRNASQYSRRFVRNFLLLLQI